MRRGSFIIALGAATLVVAGCGGGERQDKSEPSGTFNVEVVDAKFPSAQRLAKQEEMTIEVRNADTRTIPQVAVTVNSFSTREERQDLADPNRPAWIVDSGPSGGATAYTNTWAMGALKPGQTKTFTWHVTPVAAGTHKVSYRVAAGLTGKAKAQLAGGQIPEGSFAVDISSKPAQATVDPDTGEVVREGDSDSSGT